MIIYKCKMCGGNLSVQEGNKIAICEYCKTQQTVPSTDDEKRINLFNRANHFRQNSEFDKAMGIYEHILAEDSSDAEAYWAIALCKFGIEYVEDPTSKIRKPTINRTQAHSILQDADYLSALEHAAYSQQEIYKREAEEIDQIHQDILRIARAETPYDIFISYKEKASNGDRTKSSVLSQNLYNCLKTAGYKVFFSRISLEDKVGQKYEPYIYSALNTAKVMLVVGTNKEEFTAPWVRNEWSRFLVMMRENSNKVLIPCFRDIDIDDLPNEFQVLQGQDMSKVGFEQDLLRGISKIIARDEDVVSKSISSETGSNLIQPVDRLIQNADTYMRLVNFDSAFSVYTEVSRYYPEDYRGWWGLIQSSTCDFQVDDYDGIKNQNQLNQWFEYVRELAPSEMFQEKLRLYRTFWENLSETHAISEMHKVDKLLNDYQSQIDTLNSKISTINQEEDNRKKAYQRDDQNCKYRIDEEERTSYRLNDEAEKIKQLKKTGWGILLVGGATGFIIMGIAQSNAVLGAMQFAGALFWLSILIGAIVIRKGSKLGKISQKHEQIDKCRELVHSNEKEREKLKIQYEREIKVIREKKNPINTEITQINQKIKECINFAKHDNKEIASLMFALDCGKFGESIACNQELLELRNRIWGICDTCSDNSDGEVLDIPCYVCKTMNHVSVIEIRSNKDSFKCNKCGTILHVKL